MKKNITLRKSPKIALSPILPPNAHKSLWWIGSFRLSSTSYFKTSKFLNRVVRFLNGIPTHLSDFFVFGWTRVKFQSFLEGR